MNIKNKHRGMVIVRAHVIAGRSRRKKEELIAALSSAVTESTGVAVEQVRVLLMEIGSDGWGIPGRRGNPAPADPKGGAGNV